jgi:TatD DNase family protein
MGFRSAKRTNYFPYSRAARVVVRLPELRRGALNGAVSDEATNIRTIGDRVGEVGSRDSGKPRRNETIEGCLRCWHDHCSNTFGYKPMNPERPTAYFDAHNHWQDPGFDRDRAEIIASLKSLNIKCMVVNGTTETDWFQVQTLAASDPSIIPSFGIHPWFAVARTSGWARSLERIVVSTRSAIGETGLDRYIPNYDIRDQKIVFEHHLRLAVELNRPITIHCLYAVDDLLEVFERVPVPACGFLIHAYSSGSKWIEHFTRLGAYFSFSGYFLNRGKEERLEAFKAIPDERLLVETDAPSMLLPPEKERFSLGPKERLNHPGNLLVTYQELATLRGISEGELRHQIEQNFIRLFGPVMFNPAL